ncbi:MAG TPA: hypothetical protein VMF11_14775 [Candidatus Baltobacteraceae bacterium]|nr:hypothetical protein [Candidatus Baltobacteraceae bacterium]
MATAVVLQISMYDANGNLLAQSTIGPINTTLANIPAQSVSVGGVPATIVLSPAGLSAGDDGLTHQITFVVTAQDADGNIIVPPGSYPNPIALAISGDPNGALSLSTASLASPGPTDGGTLVTLTYNSTKAITQATITATSGSITASVPFVPIVFTPSSPLPLPLYVGGTTQSVTLSEAGYGGAFNVTGTSSVATVTCVPTNCTPASTGGSIVINIAPGGVGSETVSAVDSNGGFANIPITVTGSSGGGEVVAPQYTIDKYPVAVPSGGPPQLYGITTGPDGQSLWAVDRGDQTLDVIASPSACTSTACAISSLPGGYFDTSYPYYFNLQSILTGADGNLYVSDGGNVATTGTDLGQLYQLTGCSAASASCSATNSQTFPVVTPAPGPLLTGPDGNLYVGSQAVNGMYYDWGAPIMISPIVGCCSFSSSLMIWLPDSTGTAPSSVNGLAIDASGATLWFTDGSTGNIGFVAVPCQGQCPATELPDGAYEAGSVRRRSSVARAGKKIVHPYAQRNLRHVMVNPGSTELSTALNGIISGPDGYLYIADPGNHAIDQIDPAVWDGASDGSYNPCSGTCEYTAIPLPQTNGLPMNLTIGADGNVWFTDTTGYVGFVSLGACASPSGCKAFEYSVGGSPWGITAGSDGDDVWFTLSTQDSSGNSIGKVVL